MIAWLTYARRTAVLRSGAAALAAGIALILSGPGLAQTASQLTEDSYEPPQQRLSGALVFSGAPGLKAPEGADQLSIRLSGVEVEGTLPGMEDETEALRARLTRGRIAASELFEASAGLEAAYANEGYVLARVILPAQTLRDGGTLRLQVVDGFVERVDLENVPEPLRDRLQALTDPIVGQRGIRLSQIERQILLAGDTYGVALGSALQAGATPGGTVILLDPEYKQTTGFFGLDNSISDDLGGWKFDSGVELNGALGFGEVIYARASGNPSGFFSDHPTLRTLSLGGVVPLGFNGLTLNLEANQSLSTADTDPEAPSEFERYSVRLYYPWVRSRARNITTQLSFDVQNDRQDVVVGGVEQGVYKDELRVLRLSGDGFWLTPQGGSVELGARLSLGLDSMGARSADDVNGGTPLSTPGADADFTKLELTGRYRMPLNEVYQLTLNGRVQTSFGEPLVKSEQMGIATAREISAFDAGSLTGDRGWVMRVELSRGFQAEAGGTSFSYSPYVFAAAGAVFLEDPTAEQQSETNASAYGVGLDFFYPFQSKFSNASVRIELAKGTRNDDASDGTRVSIAGNFRF